MIKVFETFNFSLVGQARSLLEAEGIATFVRNEFASSVMGEIPFIEVCPQPFVLDESEAGRASGLLKSFESSPPANDWKCPQCDSEVEGPFGQCWSCGQLRPA